MLTNGISSFNLVQNS